MADVESPEARLNAFIDKFDPKMAAHIRSVRKALRQRLPGAVELVYDNYNFFVIAYGPNERASEAILSLAAQAKGVTICFAQGTRLPDPDKLLTGSGKQFRNLRIQSAEELARPEVGALIDEALNLSRTPMPAARGFTVIKAVSARQRPRRIVK